jgi:hypothetical protein
MALFLNFAHLHKFIVNLEDNVLANKVLIFIYILTNFVISSPVNIGKKNACYMNAKFPLNVSIYKNNTSIKCRI